MQRKTRALSIVLCFTLAVELVALTPESVREWKEDIDQVRQTVLEVHPDPFRHVDPERLDLAFDELISMLPKLQPYEAAMELAEVVALLGDGHTRLTLPLAFERGFVAGHSPTPLPEVESLQFQPLGIRVGIYAEGIIVERAEAPQRDLVGSRVLAIGGVPIVEARRRLASVIRHDNDRQLADLLPMFLVVPEVLASRGLSPGPDRATFDLLLPNGAPRRVVLERERELQPWVAARRSGHETPLSLRYLGDGLAPRRGSFDRDYWYEVSRDGRTLYLQYNNAEDSDDEPIVDFARRLRSDLDSEDLERIIVDLRWNWGGNNSASRPLLHALISAEAPQKAGGLFVLIGRSTYSAAMMFATDLERHLRPVFVGERTGSSPNHSGDARKVRLANTGLTLRVSTLWWQYGGPRDGRNAIEAHLEFEPSWDAFSEHRDPPLETSVSRGPRNAVNGTWSGRMTPPAQDFPLELEIEEVEGRLYGWLTAEGLGERLPISDGRRQGDRLAFRVRREAGDLDFEAVVLDDGLAGWVVYDEMRAEPFAFGMRSVARD